MNIRSEEIRLLWINPSTIWLFAEAAKVNVGKPQSFRQNVQSGISSTLVQRNTVTKYCLVYLWKQLIHTCDYTTISSRTESCQVLHLISVINTGWFSLSWPYIYFDFLSLLVSSLTLFPSVWIIIWKYIQLFALLYLLEKRKSKWLGRL